MVPINNTFMIICPLVFLAGFVDSVAGGGGVISLPAYLLAGIPIKLAAGTNKFVNGCGTALACYNYSKSGNVNWVAALPAAVFSLLGSVIGTNLAVYMPDKLLKTIVLIALPLVAIALFLTKTKDNDAEKPFSKQKAMILAGIIGLIIGLYDGLIGPGTGTFLTIAFTGVLGYSLLKSSGCARVANLASNVASTIVYLINGMVVFKIAIPAVICALLGAQMGSRYAINGGSAKIRVIMFFVLALLFVKLALNLFGIPV